MHTGPLYGVQLWIAQPSATRSGAPAFEHHADLPRLSIDGAEATVLVGEFVGVASPARRDTEHLGVELIVRGGRVTVPLDVGFEHAVLALGAGVSVAGRRVERGQLGYLGVGRDEVVIDAENGARVLLFGGARFDEQVLMWWNYVARTRNEILTAHEDWSSRSERFGRVASRLPRIDATGPAWSRMG